jgi:hypothetical protein
MWGVAGEWTRDWDIVGVDFRLVRDVSLTGVPPRCLVRKKFKKAMKKLSPTSGRLVHWIAAVPSSRISFATSATVSSSLAARARRPESFSVLPCRRCALLFPFDSFPFCRRDGHPFLRQELRGRACHGKVLVETAPDHLEIFQLTAAVP